MAPRRASSGCLALAAVLAAAPAGAWTRESQVAIVQIAATLAPKDLTRQLERHRYSLRQGAVAPFADARSPRHEENPDGSGALAEVVRAESRRTIAAIRGHRPFSQIVEQMGVLSHFVADLNDPLRVANQDPREPTYAADYPLYLDAARRRFQVIYYGAGRRIDSSAELATLVERSLARGRRLYPDVGREYRRIGGGSGNSGFDDRSTAFGVGSLAFSHAVSDVAAVWRYVWLEAGGSDRGALPTLAGDRLVLLRNGPSAR